MKTQKHNFDLFWLTILLTFLFFIFLGDRPLSVPDEARYGEIPREMLALHDYITPYLNGLLYFEKPPLLYWLNAASLHVWGISEWAVRFPTAVLALLGCLFVFTTARAQFDRTTAWLSSITLATSLLYFAMAHTVTIDMTLTFLISTCLLAFWRVITLAQTGIRARWLCYLAYFSAALAVLTKGLVGALLPGAVLLIWMILSGQWFVLRYLYIPTGLLLFLAASVPWHLAIQSRHPEFFNFYFLDQQFLRYLTMNANRYKPAWFFTPILLLGLFPWVIFFFQAIREFTQKTWKKLRSDANLFLWVWAIFIFLFFSFSKSKLIPYILPVFPALAILIGHYLKTHLDEKPSTAYFSLMGISLIFGVGFLLIPRFVNFTIEQTGLEYLRVLSGLSFGFLILSILGYCRHWMIRQFVPYLLILTSIWLMGLLLALPYVDTRSIKPLAVTLQQKLSPRDEVVTYGLYYQDLPFYIARRITIVGWRNELTFGFEHQAEAKHWMIQSKELWRRWSRANTMYMLVDRHTYETQLLKQRHRLYYIDGNADNVLVSNHEA